MAEEEKEEKQGLEWLSDADLASIVKEATNEGNFNESQEAQSAFRELEKRDPNYGR